MKHHSSNNFEIYLPKTFRVKFNSNGVVANAKSSSIIIDCNENKSIYEQRVALISKNTPSNPKLKSVMKRLGKTDKPYPGIEHLVEQTSLVNGNTSFAWSLMVKCPTRPRIYIQLICKDSYERHFPALERCIHSFKVIGRPPKSKGSIFDWLR